MSRFVGSVVLCCLSFIVSNTFAVGQEAEAKKAPAQAEIAPAQDRNLTGVLSEEEFKALHELKEGEAPKLSGQNLEIEGAGRAYLSLPAGKKGPLPAVIVIHEWWGLNDHVKHWTDRFAALGYAALAIDLYGGQVATSREDAMKFMQGVEDVKGIAVLKAAHAFLEKDDRIKATKTGSVGWCFGGRWSQHCAIELAGLDAAVMYYGQPITDAPSLARIKCPLLGIYGTKDKGIPPTSVAELDQALSAAKIVHTFHSYDAVHAFANPSNPNYDAKSASDAFEKVKVFFAEHLQK